MRPIKHTSLKWKKLGSAVIFLFVLHTSTQFYLLVAKCYIHVHRYIFFNHNIFKYMRYLCYSRNVFLRRDTKIKSNIRKSCSNRIKISTIKSTFNRLLDKLYTYSLRQRKLKRSQMKFYIALWKILGGFKTNINISVYCNKNIKEFVTLKKYN